MKQIYVCRLLALLGMTVVTLNGVSNAENASMINNVKNSKLIKNKNQAQLNITSIKDLEPEKFQKAPPNVPVQQNVVNTQKPEENSFSLQNLRSRKAVTFNGMTESGIAKNGFLCGKTGVGNVSIGGVGFDADDCSSSAIANAVGIDMSQGHTLQFFNNFTYWLRQKALREQNLKINDSYLSDNDITEKMQSEGWGSISAFCVFISTNPIIQKVIMPTMQPKNNEIKLVAQLWYNGNSTLELWSQDVSFVPLGKQFYIELSNAQDNSALFTTVQTTVQKSVNTYMDVVAQQMQPNNRHMDTYNQAQDSPRSIKVIVV